MAMTDAQIKTLQPRAARYLISDGRGLSLDVLPSGVKSWMYRYRHDGKPQKVTLGRYPDLTLKAARDKRDELATQVVGGRSPAEEKKARREGRASEPTMREFGDRYYREQAMRNRKHPAEFLRYLTTYVYPAIGQKRLKELTALDIQAIVYKKRDEGHETAALMIRQNLKLIFDYAINLHLIPSNPATMVAPRYIGRHRKRSRTMDAKEIRTYLHGIEESSMCRQFQIALRILLLTLKRKGELLGARWQHIDFEKAEWIIPAENSKSKRPQIVPLSSQVVEMFRELQPLACGSEYVMPGRFKITRPLSGNSLNKGLESVTFENLEHLTIHDLRRTGATLLTEHGWNADVIEKALAHEKTGIRAVYIVAEHLAERRRMLQWWANFIDGVEKGSNVLVMEAAS
jgi:integrase